MKSFKIFQGATIGVHGLDHASLEQASLEQASLEQASLELVLALRFLLQLVLQWCLLARA